MRLSSVLASLITLSAVVGCNGENAKSATAAVVGKGIEVSKGTVTGIAAGIEEGRKQGESADGALIVSNGDELKANGGVSFGDVAANGEESDITLLVENTSDKPMRLTKLAVVVLDTDGIAIDNRPAHVEMTVPAKAKARLLIHAKVASEKVGTVRLYGVDVPR